MLLLCWRDVEPVHHGYPADDAHRFKHIYSKKKNPVSKVAPWIRTANLQIEPFGEVSAFKSK
jgi:hypothetical protein